jgi:hypothetical protein
MAELRQQKPGRSFRRPWDYVEHDVFFKDVDTSSLPPISFEPWVPAAVRDEAKKIHAECLASDDPATAVEPLLKLISDIRMKRVWAELYRKKLDGDGFVNQMCMYASSYAARAHEEAAALRAKGGYIGEIQRLEEEATICERMYDPYPLVRPWTEQDLAVQNLLWQIYHHARDTEPMYSPDIRIAVEALRQSASKLHGVAKSLKSNSIAERVWEVASCCEAAAAATNVDLSMYPSMIMRDCENDGQVRTFVCDVGSTIKGRTGKFMFGTVATLAKVIYSIDNLTSENVREIIRTNQEACRRFDSEQAALKTGNTG